MRFRMPWIDGNAVLQRAYTLDDYAQQAQAIQSEGVVYVEVDVAPQYALLEARRAVETDVLGVVAHAPVDFGFDLFRKIEIFSFLQQQLFINQRRDQFRLVLFDFGVGLRFAHAVLLQRIDALFHFALELRKGHHAVVHLRNNFIDDDRFAFLGASAGRKY